MNRATYGCSKIIHSPLRLSLALIAATLGLFACQNKTDQSWTKAPKESAPTTVPFKGHAVAVDTFIKIAEKADASIVNIGSTQVVSRPGPKGRGLFDPPSGPDQSPFDDLFRRFFGGGPFGDLPQEDKRSSLGSGFVLSKDGLIVTNNHVVEKATEIKVTLAHDDQEYLAKVVGTDPKTDVALIKIEPKGELQPLELGDSSTLRVGEIVVAIGNPFGLSHTVTQGIVSAKERTIGFGPYDNFIQTDASINPGNSGGPLLNLEAKVVGINTAIIASGQGIGFAIPINLARDILKQLQDKGSVTRGWLGVYIQKVDADLAQTLGMKDTRGALVSDVQKNSPAEKVGIKVGDVILKVEGKEIKDSIELPRLVAGLKVGQKTTLTLLRDGKTLTVQPEIGELKNQDEEETSESGSSKDSSDDTSGPDALGLMTETLTPAIARRLGLDPELKGVVITDVEPNSDAARKELRSGQVILKVASTPVASVQDYKKAVQNAGKDSVLLYVDRGRGGRVYVAVKRYKKS